MDSFVVLSLEDSSTAERGTWYCFWKKVQWKARAWKTQHVEWVPQPTIGRSGLLDHDAQRETLDLDAQQEAALLIILKLDLQCKGLTSELLFPCKWISMNACMEKQQHG